MPRGVTRLWPTVVITALGVVSLVALLIQHTRRLAAAHFQPLVEASDWCAPLAAGGYGTPHAEAWAPVVGGGGVDAASAADCCSRCAAHRDCNVFVFCDAPARCGSQCWLKRVGSTAQALAALSTADPSVPWRSGVLSSKVDDVDVALLPAVDARPAVELRTPHGAIRLRLRDDLAPDSTAFVRRLSATPALCTSACEFYRAEPGFLLQGSMRSRIPSNNVTAKGPVMHKGMVGWAGGSAGPDFFIYLGSQPATHWGNDHTVFAELADAQSLAVAELIVQLKPSPTKPGDMHMLERRVPFEFG